MPPNSHIAVAPAIANLPDIDGLTTAAIPCHRCGDCCTRWQPLLTPEDADGLATHLGLSDAAFHARYTLRYPFDDEARLLRQEDGVCVFLGWETDGRSTCTVHSARPAVCREWSAGLEQRECRRGLERAVRTDGSLDLPLLYPDGEERAAFIAAWSAARPRSIMPELSSLRFAGVVCTPDGEPVGEARFWASGSHGPEGAWSGWLYVADLGSPPPGRYQVIAFAGWQGDFQIESGAVPTRVIETDLLPVTGAGPAPWPETAGEPVRQPALVGTPWQGSRGIPPYKQQGDGNRLPSAQRSYD